MTPGQNAEPRRFPYAVALHAANRLVELLRPRTERIEIAGSIRRERMLVKDIELVLVPKFEPSPDVNLFGESPTEINLLVERLNQMVRDGQLEKRLDQRGQACWGPRHQRAVFEGIPVDIFGVVAPADWGVIFAIRTGPREFGERCVTKSKFGGFLPEDLVVEKGGIHRFDGNEFIQIPCPEEDDFFRALGFKTVPAPCDRGRGGE